MDKLIEGEEEMVRFYCDCYDPRHVLELVTHHCGKHLGYVEFRPFVCGKGAFKWRLRNAWNLLRGEDTQLSEFLLRPEDIVPIAHFLLNQIPSTTSNEYV